MNADFDATVVSVCMRLFRDCPDRRRVKDCGDCERLVRCRLPAGHRGRHETKP